MKMFERLQAKKKDNKGFSLVELIIVIAIMAILVGVVGTQVVPYLNKSKVAKDQQVLNAFCTAAVSGYSYKADRINATGTLTFDYYTTVASTADGATAAQLIKSEMEGLITYADLPALIKQMGSDYGKKATGITITFDFSNNKCTAHLVSTSTKKPVVEDVVSAL